MNYLIGQQIEHYQVEALLGEGGMGTVYRALDLKHDRLVALKVMHSHLSQQPQFQQRFAQEAQAVVDFNSPAIIKIFQYSAYEGNPFIAMEYVAGGSLTSFLKQLQWSGKRMALAEVISLGAQVAEGLSYAHQRGLIHRDIKPDNIMLRLQSGQRRSSSADVPPTQAVITDFGLAIQMAEAAEVATNPFMGSLPYMSPEQCANKALDGRSDIYSLGIMLYQLTTGQLPFKIAAPADIVKHLHEPPLPPRLINPDLPEAIETIIIKCLAKKPSERYQTGAELAHTLRQAASTTDGSALAPQLAGSQIVTQWVEQRWIAGVEVRNRIDVNQTWTSEADFRLLVAHQWEQPRIHSLGKERLSIGRHPQNDIVLEDKSVSARHAILEKTESGWQLRDLGSTNGTTLGNNTLDFDKPVDWAADQTVRIGPYALQWQPFSGRRSSRRPSAGPGRQIASSPVPAPAISVALTQPPSFQAGPAMARREAASELGATTVSVPPSAPFALPPRPQPSFEELPFISESGVLSVLITPAELEIEPGTETALQVTVRNQGLTVEDISLRVEENGLTPGWATLDQNELKLMPDESQTVTLALLPPQDSTLLAGRHALHVIASTARGQSEMAQAHIQIEKWEEFLLDMHPAHLQEGVIGRVNINDRGNFDNTYNVVGLDDSDALLFHFDEQPGITRTDVETQQLWLNIVAGREGYAGFTIAPKRRAWFGRDKTLPFEMRVRTPTSDWQPLIGQVDIRPRISRRVLFFFIALLLILGGCGYYGYTRIQEINAQRLAQLQAESDAELAAAQELAGQAQADAEAARLEAEAAQAAVDEAIAQQRSAEEIAALQAEAADAAAQAAVAEASASAAQEAEASAAEAAAQAAATATAAAQTSGPSGTGASATPSNVAPTNVQLSASSVPENSPIGTVIGTFTTVDPDAAAVPGQPAVVLAADAFFKPRALGKILLQRTAFTYRLVAGSGDKDNAAFTIEDDKLKTAILFDFETQNLYSIRVQTDDGAGGVYEQPFIISITNVNDVPAFSSLPVIAGRQDIPYTYNIVIDDPDAGDTLRITAPTLPLWLTLTDNGNGTATLTGTPTNSQVGKHNVTLEVKDRAGEKDSQSFVITVVDINDPPKFSSTPPTSATQGQLYNYSVITTVDPDANEVLTISASPLPLPKWLTLTDNGDGTAVLKGTPGNSDVGNHNVSLKVSDRSGAADTQTFTIVVANVNDPPRFSSSPVTNAMEDAPYVYNVTTTDPDSIFGDTRTISVLTLPLPSWLTFTDNGDGTATFSGTPTNSHVGNYLITMEVADVARATERQTFTLNVINVNDPPQATDDAINVNEGATATTLTSGATTLLANDTDPDPPGQGDQMTVSAATISGPSHGTVTLNGNGTFSYTHDDSETTSDAFVYQVCDNGSPSGCDTATVNITVNPVNDPPINTIPSGPLSTNEDVNLQINGVSVSDQDIGTGDLRITLATSQGTLTLNTTAGLTFSTGNGVDDATMTFTGKIQPVNTALGAITFKPNPNYNGPATVQITSNDQHTTNPQQDSDQISITVVAVNDPPTFDPISDRTISENAGVTTIILTGVGPGGGADEAGQTLVFSAVSDNNALIATGSINITGSGVTRTLSFGPPATNLVGIANITVTADDNSGGTETHVDTFQVTVTAVNDPPVFDPIANPTPLLEGNTTPQTLTITGVGPGGGPDEATQFVTMSAASSNPAIVPNPTISPAASNTAATRTLTYQAANVNAAGTVTITVTATDSGGTANGGVDTFQRTFQITIININDPPTFNAIANQSMNEDATPPTVTITGVDPGGAGYETGQTVTLAATSNNQAIIPNAGLSVTGSGTSRTLTFAPVTDANGVVIITVTATDNGGTANGGVDTFQRTFQVTILSVNDAPTFNQISNPAPVLEDSGTHTVSITGVGPGGGSDEAGQIVNFTAISADTTIVPTPSFTGSGSTRTLSYTPNPNAHGTVNITVIANDGGGTARGGVETFQRTFQVTITPVNDAPFFDPIANQTVAEDSTNTVTITGVDPGGAGFETGQTVTLAATSSNQAIITNASLTVTGSGSSRTLTIAPVTNAAGGPVTITVTATDNGGTANGGVNTFQRTFQLTVTPINDAPVLNTTVTMNLTGVVSNTIPPGTTVAAILATGAGGNPITDVDAGALEGIAITGMSNAQGQWQYSINGGVSWANIPSNVGNNRAVLLDITALLRFVPNTNMTGTRSINFRAWDQTDGNANGATDIDVRVNGGTTAYSTATGTATVTVQ